MTDDTGKTDRIWAYVHGQMSRRERKDMERSLQEDPELRQALEDVKQADSTLRALMPIAEWQEEELPDRILQSIEADSKKAARDARRESGTAALRRLIDMFRVPQFRLAPLAVATAVALLLLVCMPYFTRDPIRWDSPEFVPMEYRGDPAQGPGVYTRADAKACLSLVKKALGNEIERSRGIDGRWRLSFRFDELPKGKFIVRVTARGAAPERVEEWTLDCEDLGAYESEVQALARRIVSVLGADSGEKTP